MVQVNLLPDLVLNRRREARIRQLSAMLFVAWVAIVLVVTLVSLLARVYIDSQLKSATNNYNQEYAKVNSSDNIAFRKEALEVQTSLNNLQQLFGQQATLSDLTTRITQLIPAGVYIKNLTLAQGGKMDMQVVANSYAEAAELVSALKATNMTDKSYPAAPAGKGWFDNVIINGATLGTSNTINLDVGAVYHSGTPSTSTTSTTGSGQ